MPMPPVRPSHPPPPSARTARLISEPLRPRRSLTMKKTYRVAVIPGDGIGKEVVPEGVRALEQAARKHGFALELDWFDFANVEYYEKHGRMMPEGWEGRM